MKQVVAMLLLFLAFAGFAVTLCVASKTTPYKEVEIFESKNTNGYFTVLKKWRDTDMGHVQIIYANDTRVMYLCLSSASTGITPLYNADGTLQIYEGK